MTRTDILLAFGVIGIAVIAAFSALALFASMDARARRAEALRTRASDDDNVAFLFAGDQLLDATRHARQVLSAAPKGASDWQRLCRLLATRFPDFADTRAIALDAGRTTLLSPDGATRLVLEPEDGTLRVTIIDIETTDSLVQVDRLSLSATQHELDTLRAIADGVPWLVWRESAPQKSGYARNGHGPMQGAILWANSAYLDCVEQLTGQAETWPPPHVFDTDPARDGFGEPRRLQLRNAEKSAADWYTVFAQPQPEGVIYSAVPAAREVAADSALGAFRQTLTQTFASLSVGLAVFDNRRVLTMFNPALIDILDVPVEFATSIPTLFAFLDRLRENRRMPEPRNYRNWRDNMAELEDGAASQGYSATWTLSDGQVLRVTGRPHGDGAMVLIFEDISTEIALTRQFRAELDLNQAVIDTMDEALAIFDTSGVLVISNQAYASLWGSDPRTSLGDMTLPEATQRWNARTSATPLWKQLNGFLRQRQDRAGWTDSVRMTDGRALEVRIEPLAGGATLVGFRIDAARRGPSVDLVPTRTPVAGASG